MDLIITVKEINGHCPTYKTGDSFTLKGRLSACKRHTCLHAWPGFFNALL